MAISSCQQDTSTESYMELVVSLPVFIILHVLLFGNTMFYEWKSYKKNRGIKRKKLGTRISFIFLQLNAIYFMITELLRTVIDPLNKFAQRNGTICFYLALNTKIFLIMYYGIYMIQILLRLEMAFHGSYLALNKVTLFILTNLICIPTISTMVIYLSYAEPPCILNWEPFDVADTLFGVCYYQSRDGFLNVVALMGIFIVVIVNIIHGIIFAIKLKKLLNHDTSFDLKTLTIKHTTLTIIATISTMLCWILTIVLYGIVGFG
eukprot:422775_1